MELLSNHQKEFPFASSKFLAGWLMTSRMTIAGVPRDNLGVRKDRRRWPPQHLTEAQNLELVRFSRSLPESLSLHEDTEFKALAAGDE
jgi:hypothetical protein